MNFSDYISLAALIVSIAAGIGNYLYTRKAFEASTYPSLQAWLVKRGGSDGGTYFAVGLTNLSSSISIADVKILIAVANPLRGWRLWQKKWLVYHEDAGPDMAPLTSSDDVSNTQTRFSIEYFLAKHLPSLMNKTEVQWPSGTKSDYYRLFKSQPLSLLLTVTYRPGVTGGGFRKVSKMYLLTPHFNSTEREPDKLSYWEIQERC